MTKVRISPDLALPLDAATQTFLIVGKRGSGKSSTAARVAEQLVGAKVPIAVLDPVDVWWGLKAGADGQRAGGLDVYVFGGAHADLPLEPTAGALIADVLVDHRVRSSCGTCPSAEPPGPCVPSRASRPRGRSSERRNRIELQHQHHRAQEHRER